MQDVTEQQEVAQEISDAISKSFGDQFDEVGVINKKRIINCTHVKVFFFLSCSFLNVSGLL